MSGTIGIIADAAARYTYFSECLGRLHRPVNTTEDWAIGSERAIGRNKLVARSLEKKKADKKVDSA